MSDQSQNDDDHGQGRDLSSFANAGAQRQQPTPGGHALVRPTTGLAERVIGAQPVAVFRNDQKIMQQLASMAAFAGDDWFYRFPVKKKDGGQDWIEGPSIKLANNVARIFGNNVNEVREIDVGDAWIFYARFTDIETGFSMERAYRQRKSQTSMRTRDADRQLDIAYQIGQSKAIRNCIVNSLQVYADYAFEQALSSLVTKIGSDLQAWRERTVKGIAKVPVDLVRVERTIGRSSRDWLAPHVAQVIAMLKSIADGMASVDDVFPPLPEIGATTGPAASTASPPTSERSEAADGAQGASPSGETGKGGHPAAAAPTADVIGQAYERGKEARVAGVNRKAVPVEYRDAARNREAIAWQAGLDGADRPTFPKEG